MDIDAFEQKVGEILSNLVDVVDEQDDIEVAVAEARSDIVSLAEKLSAERDEDGLLIAAGADPLS